MGRNCVGIVGRERAPKLDWRDAQLETPPDQSLFLLVELTLGKTKRGKVTVAEVITGFFVDGDYLVGTSAGGHPLSANQVVRYWAQLDWPEAYEDDGSSPWLDLKPKALSATCSGVAL